MSPQLAKLLVRAIFKILELFGRAKWYQEGRDAILEEQRIEEEKLIARADGVRARPVSDELRNKYTRGPPPDRSGY
jgi:hypothetical protein